MNEVFFRASQDALVRITDVFDFVHPLTASMKFTRATVKELNDKGKTPDEIVAIIDPDHSVHGVNFQRAFIETAWLEHEERLAWVLLNNLFAIHEGWAQRLYDEAFSALGFDEREFVKNLAHSDLTQNLQNYFVPPQLTSLLMKNSFYPVYRKNCSFPFDKLDNYMLCYRYFKEVRNCYMHRNSIASNALMTAYNAYHVIETLLDLDLSEVPVLLPPKLGDPVHIRLRGVIGFSHIVQRIITLTDVSLLCSKAAETEFTNRAPHNWLKRTFSSDSTTAEGQAASYARKAGFLGAEWSEEYRDYLLKHQIFSM